MKSILITGASGLVGRELLALLHEDKHLRIYAMVEPNDIGFSEYQQENLKILPCDLSKPLDIGSFPSQVDTIIHMAMSQNSKDFPNRSLEIFHVNTLSTLYLLNYAVEAQAKRFIFTSTGIYNDTSVTSHTEDETIFFNDTRDFYLSTKACSEILLRNYSAFFSTIILRLFFVYGKAQRKEMFIPRLINNIKHGNPIYIDEEGGIKVNPIHVKDAASSIYRCISLDGNHVVNLAGNEVVSIRQIAEMIGDILLKEPVYEVIQKTHNMIADNSKMKQLLAPPSITLERGLREMIEDKAVT